VHMIKLFTTLPHNIIKCTVSQKAIGKHEVPIISRPSNFNDEACSRPPRARAAAATLGQNPENRKQRKNR